MFFKSIVGGALAAIVTVGSLPGPAVSPAYAQGTQDVVLPVPAAKRARPSHAFQAQTLKELRWLPSVPHRGTYATGALAGDSIGNLYAWYIGHSGKIPAKLAVDWNRQLAHLWERKRQMSDTTVVRDTGTMLVAEYERLDPELMSLAHYQRIGDRQAKLVYRSLDWDQVGAFYFADKKAKKADVRKVALLKRITKHFDGQMLISYMGAELCPTSGRFCTTFLDFMLQHGGRRYVESIPALNDDLTSFGPFQFTANAVYDVGNVPTVGNASRVSRALPRKLRLPASMTLFRGDDHFRGAEVFAIANAAMLIRRLDGKQLATLASVADTRQIEWAQFIATAHNKPEAAYAAAERWLDAKARAGEYREGCSKASKLYAHKTFENYQALVELASR